MANVINYFKEFFYSKYNAILAGCTLGIGLLSAHPFVLILGIVAYGLGLMFIHDSPWFRNIVDQKYSEQDKLQAYKQVEEFKARRAKQLQALTSSRRQKYLELVEVGKAIEQATSENTISSDNTVDSRLQKIDELIWTFLKLLTIEQSLDLFIESERQDDLPKDVKEVESRLMELTQELETLKANPKTDASVMLSKERLFNSYGERRDVLNKRIARVEQAKANIEVVNAEQERLQQQVKLIRSDAIATRNTESLTSRIDASLEHLGETNKWLSEMNDFKDIVGDMPESVTSRIGFGEENVPSSSIENYMLSDIAPKKVRVKRGNYIET